MSDVSSSGVHLFVPSLEPSAVGFHTLEAQRTVREMMGRSSEVFTDWVDAGLAGRGRPFTEYGKEVPASGGDVLVYQMAVGSKVADFVQARPEPLVLNYHNLTPARMLSAWDDGAMHAVTWGRRQLRELAGRTELGVAVSGFNERELVEAGYRRTVVVPVLVDFEAMGSVADRGLERRLAGLKSGGGSDWLFVGRLSPNKCQHQVIKAFATYRRLYDGRARLWLVGSSSSALYLSVLERFVEALGLGDAVTLTGSVSQEALVSYYRQADVFVCLSEHEGFCIPLLEAMWHRVPVVALASSAVPETLGRAGVLLGAGEGASLLREGAGRQPLPSVVAAAVARVVSDGSVRDALVAAGADRVGQFSLDHTRRQFVTALEGLCSS